jgi:phthiodiolone/phenolphthiodiolone dimycocerosates ketoreductase
LFFLASLVRHDKEVSMQVSGGELKFTTLPPVVMYRELGTNKRIRFSREFGGDNALQVAAEAVRSEALGFDILWVPDHLIDINPLFSIFDAWTMLSHIGAKTSRAKLGSGVTDVQRIHPAKTANIVATLDNLTGGRAVLGIGSGEIMNTEPYGIEFESARDRIQRTKEAIQVIRALWESSPTHPANYQGEFYALKNAFLSLAPIQKPTPPIYVGTFYSPKMVRVAGEVADGWYPAAWFDAESYRKKVLTLEEGAKSSGRTLEDIDVIANIPTIVMDRKEDRSKMEAVKKGLKRRMIVNRYLFKILGVGDELSKLPRNLEYQLVTPGSESDSALSRAVDAVSVPDEVLEKAIDSMMAIGSVDACVSAIERFIEAGATHVYFPDFIGSRENYELISKEIMPRLAA